MKLSIHRTGSACATALIVSHVALLSFLKPDLKRLLLRPRTSVTSPESYSLRLPRWLMLNASAKVVLQSKELSTNCIDH